MDDRYIKTDFAGMVVDTDSKAVINTNNAAYTELVAKRKRDRELRNLHNEVAQLKIEMAELRRLIESKNVQTDY
jgi:hypothetical protein